MSYAFQSARLILYRSASGVTAVNTGDDEATNPTTNLPTRRTSFWHLT